MFDIIKRKQQCAVNKKPFIRPIPFKKIPHKKLDTFSNKNFIYVFFKIENKTQVLNTLCDKILYANVFKQNQTFSN